MLRYLLIILLIAPAGAGLYSPTWAATPVGEGPDAGYEAGLVDDAGDDPVSGADAGSGSAARAASAAESPVLLVLGDSLSAAYGLPLDQGWVSRLQERIDAQGLPHRVVNASISGDTVAGGLSRLPTLLTQWSPAVVVVELGANDGLRGFAPATIGADLTRLVEQIQKTGAEVLVAGVRLPPNYGPAYTERFQRLYAQVAAATGAALVPRLLAGVAEEPSLMQDDGLHPTAAAQPRILDNLWPELAPLLERSRR
jgi:acyl-CoA thioesterase-1